MIPPAIRFIRAFDVVGYRMVNVWVSLTTQDQVDNPPQCVDLCVTSTSIEKVMEEIRRVARNWPKETIQEIEKASSRLVLGGASFYGTMEEYQDSK